jgi:hypothetical protein
MKLVMSIKTLSTLTTRKSISKTPAISLEKNYRISFTPIRQKILIIIWGKLKFSKKEYETLQMRMKLLTTFWIIFVARSKIRNCLCCPEYLRQNNNVPNSTEDSFPTKK